MIRPSKNGQKLEIKTRATNGKGKWTLADSSFFPLQHKVLNKHGLEANSRANWVQFTAILSTNSTSQSASF